MMDGIRTRQLSTQRMKKQEKIGVRSMKEKGEKTFCKP